MAFPMPGNEIDIEGDKVTVIASSYKNDNEYCVLVLRDRPPYYAYCEVIDGFFCEWEMHRKFENICPATEFYRQESGCY